MHVDSSGNAELPCCCPSCSCSLGHCGACLSMRHLTFYQSQAAHWTKCNCLADCQACMRACTGLPGPEAATHRGAVGPHRLCRRPAPPCRAPPQPAHPSLPSPAVPPLPSGCRFTKCDTHTGARQESRAPGGLGPPATRPAGTQLEYSTNTRTPLGLSAAQHRQQHRWLQPPCPAWWPPSPAS